MEPDQVATLIPAALRRLRARHGLAIFFRPTGVGSYTATSSRPFNRRFFEELDARLAREPQPSASLLAVPPALASLRPALFPPDARA